MADHDDEISVINAHVDEVAVADSRRAHIPGIPCKPHAPQFDPGDMHSD